MRRAVLAAVVSVASIASTACGESTSNFVSNGAEKTYFKVPRSYEVFDLPTGRVDRLSPDAPEDVELIWSVGFDASPYPSIDHVTAAGNYNIAVDAPVGVANVYQVQGSFNQKLSLTSVRTVPLGFDPLYVEDDVKDLVEIIRYEPLPAGDGLQGSRVLFNMRPSSVDAWRTYDMTTYFDPGRFRMYTFTVGCLATCFKAVEDDLGKVTSSWTVKP